MYHRFRVHSVKILIENGMKVTPTAEALVGLKTRDCSAGCCSVNFMYSECIAFYQIQTCS